MSEVEIIYKDLSYELMGILFRVHRRLGNSYQEKYYQRAIEIEFSKEGIPYKREVLVKLDYENESIGRYFLDFVVQGKIALEIKTVPFMSKEYLYQVLAYLNATHLKLGIVANFRTNRLTYKRLVNPRVKI